MTDHDLIAEGRKLYAAALDAGESRVVLSATEGTGPLTDLLVWAGNNLPAVLDALEAAQRPPLGYAVTSVHLIDGSRHVHTGPVLPREDADARARCYADARVVELREVQP